MRNEFFLEVSCLTVAFPKVDGKPGEMTKVLNGLNLTIPENQFVCVLGPSGCGKTTLLNCVAGFQKFDGDILFKGSPICGPAPERGVMFQEYGLFPWFNIQQNVEFGPRMKHMPRDKRREIADTYIDMVGLSAYRKQYPNHLSGGMKQRVSLARVLANEPEFLLMDEPFAALDEQTRQKLQTELLNVWEKNKITCMFITHSISEAVFLADRVIVLMPNPGRVALDMLIDVPRMRDRNDPALLQYQEQISEVLFSGRK